MTTTDDFEFMDMTPLGEDDTIIDTPPLEPPVEPIVPEVVEGVEPDPVVPIIEGAIDPVPPVDDDLNLVPDPVEDPLIEIANGMMSKGYFKEIPDTVDPSKFSTEDFYTLMEHNSNLMVNEAIQTERSNFAGSLTNTTRDIVAFDIENPNMTDEEVLDYVQQTVYAKQITNLDPENDSEQIIRQYYSTHGWSNEEVDNKVSSLAGTEGMVTEATMLKPKLDAASQKITTDKVNQQRMIADQETRLYNDLKNRTVTQLQTGKINGIQLTQEEVNIVYNATLNQDVEVPVRGGKTMKLGRMEALIYKNRYDPKGSLESLMLASLILEKGPGALTRFYEGKAQENVINTFVRENKASALAKAGDTRTNTKQDGSLFKLRLK